jgi:hypothetical protein
VLRIRDVYPGSEFLHPGSRIKRIPDPHKRILVFLTLKTVVKMIWDVHPGSGFFFPHPGYRGQKALDFGSATPLITLIYNLGTDIL